MSVECQVNIKSQSELDIGGRETCLSIRQLSIKFLTIIIVVFILKEASSGAAF